MTALDQDYHNLVRVLSQTSMFDEYLRSRIKSCGMTVLSQSGSIFHLRRRKWRPVISQTGLSKLVNTRGLQRRITLPKRTELKTDIHRRVSAL